MDDLTKEELFQFRYTEIYRSFYGDPLHQKYKQYINFDRLRQFFWINIRMFNQPVKEDEENEHI